MSWMPRIEPIIDDVITRCTALEVLSAGRTITRLYDRLMAPTNITAVQFTLLVAIKKLQPESISQLGKYLCTERTAVSRNLKLLEQRNLVERGLEGRHRTRSIQITEAGQMKIRDTYPYWQAAQAVVDNIITKEEASQLKQILQKIRVSCQVEDMED